MYNVPGTQLEVYYDAKDYSEVPGSVADKTGNGHNGTIVGDGVGFDSTYKAFTFAGSDDYFHSTLDWSGDQVHSIAFWVKTTGTNDNQTAVYLGTTAASGYEHHMSAINLMSNGNIKWYFGGNDIQYDAKWTPNTWIHLAVSYIGGGGTGQFKSVYMNCSKLNVISEPTTSTAVSFNSGDTVIRVGGGYFDSIQEDFTGSIANLRIYEKALNADQVQELYDYQKDYFLGSKSQVTLYKGHLGVGVTEPSGQLELAGDERIQEYPPGPMSGYETHIPGHGVFCAYAGDSEAYSYQGTPHSFEAWRVFDDTSVVYHGGNRYTTAGTDSYGAYEAFTPGIIRLAPETPLGDYIVLKMPYKIKAHSVVLADGGARMPRDFIIYGSNDGLTWSSIKSITGAAYNGTHLINSTEYFSQLAMVITKKQDGDGYINIPTIRYFGTPGPTTLDKGSLTLGRSLDVPRISRYDVDTETPRPEKLVLDFDTTVNSSPTDISGQGNHGTFYNGATVSDGAFVLDGTNDYIQATTNLPVGDNSLSISMWIKTRSRHATVRDAAFFLGGTASNKGIGLDIYPNGSVYWYDRAGYHLLWNTSGTAPANVGTNELFPLNQWVHVAATHVPGSNAGYELRNKLYINGVKIPDPASGTSYVSDGSGTLSLDANPTVSLGVYPTPDLTSTPDALISNFKLYDTVLTPRRSRNSTTWAEPGGPWSSATRPSGSGKSLKPNWM